MASGTGVQRFTVALHKHHGTDHPARLQRPVDDRVDARGEFVIGTNRRQLKRNRVTFRPASSTPTGEPSGSPTKAPATSAW